MDRLVIPCLMKTGQNVTLDIGFTNQNKTNGYDECQEVSSDRLFSLFAAEPVNSRVQMVLAESLEHLRCRD